LAKLSTAFDHSPIILQLFTMAGKAPYKTTFEPERTIQPIYTGGSVALDKTGRILATTLGEDVLLTDLNTGRELARIEGVSQLVGKILIAWLTGDYRMGR
jgi:hypothetical protein